MGLGYLFLFIMILGIAGAAIALLIAAWEIWQKFRFKILVIIPVLLAGLCAVEAFYLLEIVWREPPGIVKNYA